MSGLFDWYDGHSRHIPDLQKFVCTDFKPRPRERTWRSRHGWWDYEVQSRLRDLRPPYRGHRFLRLGYDEAGLGAVSYVEEIDGPDVVEMAVGATALRLRHKGGGYADAMFSDALDVVTARAHRRRRDGGPPDRSRLGAERCFAGAVPTSRLRAHWRRRRRCAAVEPLPADRPGRAVAL